MWKNIKEFASRLLDYYHGRRIHRSWECWKKYGVFHRDNDLPSVIQSDGTKMWHQIGELHRIGGPAVIRSDGSKFWYQNDEYHRIGGPAIIRYDGSYEWFQYGELHNEDGPAVISPNGYKAWYINGVLQEVSYGELLYGEVSCSKIDHFVESVNWKKEGF